MASLNQNESCSEGAEMIAGDLLHLDSLGMAPARATDEDRWTSWSDRASTRCSCVSRRAARSSRPREKGTGFRTREAFLAKKVLIENGASRRSEAELDVNYVLLFSTRKCCCFRRVFTAVDHHYELVRSYVMNDQDTTQIGTTLRSVADLFRNRNADALKITFAFAGPDNDLNGDIRRRDVLETQIEDLRRDVAPEFVTDSYYEPVNSIRITVPRRTARTGPDDHDVDGAQQFLALTGITI